MKAASKQSKVPILCISLVAIFLSVAYGLDYATVTEVVDGDTFRIENGEKVRMIGIDTPETLDPRKPVEYFGAESKAYLESLILNKRVRLEFGSDPRDKYGRILAYVHLGEIDVNLKMVEDGYAMAYLKYPHAREKKYLDAELRARRNGIGRWGSPSSVSQPAKPVVSDREPIVYITKSGAKYHRESCRYLSKSKIPISLEDAKTRGYSACKVCKPTR